jgi:hypothetical protein
MGRGVHRIRFVETLNLYERESPPDFPEINPSMTLGIIYFVFLPSIATLRSPAAP